MMDLPRRSPDSVTRAAEIFRRFTHARSRVGRIRGESDIAMVTALVCGFASLTIHGIRSGFPFPLPALSIGQALAGMAGLMILNAAFSLPASSWSRIELHRLLFAFLPFVSLLRNTPYFRKAEAEADRKPRLPIRIHSANLGASPLRKSYFWRRFESSFAPLVIQAAITTFLFAFLGSSLARQPAATAERRWSYLLEAYVLVVGAVACYRCEKLERRGKLPPRSAVPLWPFALLPWGLAALNSLRLIWRTSPELERKALATTLFFDRTAVHIERWTSLRHRLPRLRRSELHATGDPLEAQSFLRARMIVLMFQASALGMLFPFTFPTVWTELMVSLVAITALPTGLVVGGLHAREAASRPSFGRLRLAWSAAALGSAAFGYCMGSAFGRAALGYAAALLGLAELWGGLLTVGLMGALGGKSSWNVLHAAIWLPAILLMAVFGWLMIVDGPHSWAIQLEPILLGTACCAWLIDAPAGLAYQRLFLEPFTLSSWWKRNLPTATRVRLVPTALALILPMGGLASGFLAVAAQQRDQRMLLWWQWRSELSSLSRNPVLGAGAR